MTHLISDKRAGVIRRRKEIRNFILERENFAYFVWLSVETLKLSNEVYKNTGRKRARYIGERKDRFAAWLGSLTGSETMTRRWNRIFDNIRDESERTDIYDAIADLFVGHEKSFLSYDQKKLKEFGNIYLNQLYDDVSKILR